MKQTKSQSNQFIVPLLIVMCLMFFWNLSRNINDVLIPHLKRACQLTDFQSALVQSAFFGAYFLLAIPAGIFIQKKGYKSGMVTGLVLAAVGATIFFPAAETRYYPLFLTALFVMATGFTFLEVTATPYISKLGDSEGASSRLSLSAAMGSVGASIAPYIASLLLLHEKDIPDSQIAAYSPAQLEIFLHNEAGLVKLPYISLALLFFIVAIILLFIKLPTIADEEGNETSTFNDLLRFPHTIHGVFGVFCYLGAEVGIVSFLIRYSKSLHLEGLTEQKSALFITMYMFLVLVGRVLGSAILKIFKPNKMLVISASGALFLVLIAIFSQGYFSIWSLAIIGFFTSIMYPIIFTLSIKDLGVHTKKASSLLIMGIVGGAIVPPIMGYISDKWGIRNAFFIPVICYGYVIYFALKGSRIKNFVEES